MNNKNSNKTELSWIHSEQEPGIPDDEKNLDRVREQTTNKRSREREER